MKLVDEALKQRLIKIADALTWVGAFVFLTGGIFFAFPKSNYRSSYFLEVSDFGLFLIPVCLMIFFQKASWSDFSSLRVFTTLFDFLNRSERRVSAFFTASLTLLGVSHILGSWNRYLSFNTGWDLAIYANACGNNLHSSLRDHASLLADHFEPILFFVTPLCKLFDPPMVLLVVQVCCLLIGAVGARFLAMATGRTALVSALWGLGYALFSKNVDLLYLDYHSVSFAFAFIPWLLWSVASNHFVTFLLLGMGYASVKEITSLTFAFLAALWFVRGERRKALATAALGVGLFLAVMYFVFPLFRQGGSIYFGKYYGQFGDSFGAMAASLVTRPQVWFQTLLQPQKILYLGSVFIPFAFLHFKNIWSVFPVVPALMANILSNEPYLFSGKFHYEAEIYAFLFASLLLVNVSKRWMDFAIVILLCCYSGKGLFYHIAYYKPDDRQLTLHRQIQEIGSQFQNRRIATVDRVVANLSFVPHLTLLNKSIDTDVVIIAYPRGDRLWSDNVSHIESEIVPRLNQTFEKKTPDSTNMSFRTWVRE